MVLLHSSRCVSTHTLSCVEEFYEGGEFLPLSVWETRGFPKAEIEARTDEKDKKIHPVVGLCYRVKILSQGQRGVRGAKRGSRATADGAASSSAGPAPSTRLALPDLNGEPRGLASDDADDDDDDASETTASSSTTSSSSSRKKKKPKKSKKTKSTRSRKNKKGGRKTEAQRAKDLASVARNRTQFSITGLF